jgi:hypothetical protein
MCYHCIHSSGAFGRAFPYAFGPDKNHVRLRSHVYLYLCTIDLHHSDSVFTNCLLLKIYLLLGSEGVGASRRGQGEGKRGKGGVMTQSLYVHMNKGNKKNYL